MRAARPLMLSKELYSGERREVIARKRSRAEHLVSFRALMRDVLLLLLCRIRVEALMRTLLKLSLTNNSYAPSASSSTHIRLPFSIPRPETIN